MSLGGRRQRLSLLFGRVPSFCGFSLLGRDTGIAGRVDSYEWVERGEAATTSFERSGDTCQVCKWWMWMS